MPTNPTTQHQEDAANRLLNAQRTGDSHAIDRAKAWQRFQASQQQASDATQREAARLHAIGAAGREYERQANHYYHS